MNELSTVRERIARASAYLSSLEGVVLTTFNLSGPFLEENALPTALGVEGKSAPARRVELHQRLSVTPCTVYYDPTVPPRLSGQYRYVARPVPVRGRFFHPKLVILAGHSKDGTSWVYLAVSSANLTLSGWSRNAESFGETWIHTQRQQSWSALDEFLSWLQTSVQVGEKSSETEATARIRAVLARMPARKRFPDDGSEPWAGSLYARFYSSVVNKDGLAAFLQLGYHRRAQEFWAYSPYWSEVAENVAAFGAHETILVPARRMNDGALGLSQDQACELAEHTEVRRNPDDVGARFFHMKAYWIRHSSKVYTAVGSCNFTNAGLAGSHGNVEAMLVFHADPDWLPDGETDNLDFADHELVEEEVPEPTPVAIVVAWDWRTHAWRWWLDAGSGQRDFKLNVPHMSPFAIAHGTDTKPGKAPSRGAQFTVTYHTDHAVRQWQGQIVELNLDYSTRVYGRPLTANEILESWRGRVPTWDLGGGDGDATDATDAEGADEASVAAAAFDAVNLYDLYRSMRALRDKLVGLDNHPDRQRAHLVGKPDSVMALALLANGEGDAPVVRYLVLRELYGIISEWAQLVDDELVTRVRDMARGARDKTHDKLLDETSQDVEKTEAMLDWFERELARLDRHVREGVA